MGNRIFFIIVHALAIIVGPVVFIGYTIQTYAYERILIKNGIPVVLVACRIVALTCPDIPLHNISSIDIYPVTISLLCNVV